ncbi:MAG: hypothetical protein Q8Q59_15895 [Luteolibacter sp.]|nr:hypothetical protein [Luteolibacter sp.]
MKSFLFNSPERKRSTAWAHIRGACCTGRSAKRIIHRRERHETRQQLR